jgi:probable HAF family extracellular repeat protein
MTDLGTLGGLDSQGNAINDLGEVAGSSHTATGSSAFTDQNGVMTAINTGGRAAVNDSGEIAGGGSFPVAGTPGDVFEQAFTYQNGATTVLGLLPGEGGTLTVATGINGSGEVVGFGDNSQSVDRAWKYQNGTMTDITPGGAQGSATVAAINSSGQIVGEDGDGFLYTGGKRARVSADPELTGIARQRDPVSLGWPTAPSPTTAASGVSPPQPVRAGVDSQSDVSGIPT